MVILSISFITDIYTDTTKNSYKIIWRTICVVQPVSKCHDNCAAAQEMPIGKSTVHIVLRL